MSCPSETRLQAFVDGEVTAADIDELSTHLDGCAECRALVAAVQPDGDVPERVGRYVVRRALGQGGMGVVYEAVDPELHRVIALKVLRADLGAEQKRLLGEASAMAKLSHPNVVPIYDVGRAGERAFIVMELVKGASLRHWLAREKRTVPEIVDAFLQAADGLRAAHDKALVHRDFKPDNVFVADDGRVLVGDFGLAVAAEDVASASRAEGSLAYMAPEQLAGGAVDARSDQYAFCVSLAEAIPEAERPRWLAALLARGASKEPEKRFASMEAIADALRAGRERSRGRRRLAVVLAIGAVAAVAAFGGSVFAAARRGAERVPEVCRAGDAPMTAAWNDDVAGRVQRAFASTNSPLAEAAWRSTDASLHAYVDAWRATRRRTCDAAAPADDAERAALDRKASCLDERLEMVRAVTSTLEHADASMLEQVPVMLQLLPRVAACEDAQAIANLAPPPPPEKVAAVDAAKKKIAAAAATIAAGRYEQGLVVADDAFRDANATGWFPVMADAWLQVGTAHGRLGHAQPSEQALEQAVSAATAGRAPATAVRAWIALMHFIGYEGKRWDEGYRWAEYAKAALEPMPEAYDLQVERLTWLRAMLLDQKRFEEALVVSREELALVELRFGAGDRHYAIALDGLASVLAGQCKSRDAIEPQEKACAILEKALGSPHPQLALCLNNLGALYANVGEHERAISIKQRALEMFQKVPGHPNHVAMAHRNMARSLLELGRFDEAAAQLADAAPSAAPDDPGMLVLRGDLMRRTGKNDQALAALTAAVDETRSAPPMSRVDPLLGLAEASLDAGRNSDAAAEAEQAAAAVMAVYGPASCRLAEPSRVRADALLAAGRAADALPVATRAREVATRAQIDPLVAARADFAFARALPADQAATARAVATAARTEGARDAAFVARVDRWLAGGAVK